MIKNVKSQPIAIHKLAEMTSRIPSGCGPTCYHAKYSVMPHLQYKCHLVPCMVWSCSFCLLILQVRYSVLRHPVHSCCIQFGRFHGSGIWNCAVRLGSKLGKLNGYVCSSLRVDAVLVMALVVCEVVLALCNITLQIL